MKIVYILKKGFHLFPPCLAQVLYLNDLGVDLTVYHGNNSDYINEILDSRKIEHYTLASDRSNTNRLGSITTAIKYTLEMKKIIAATPKDAILWFGNCESAISLRSKIKDKKFVFTVLELYDYYSPSIDKMIKKLLPYAAHVVCCEKHRAILMQAHYGMDKLPTVIPNKPYPLFEKEIKNKTACMIKEKYSDKRIVIYQGVVREDRPIDNIAYALKNLNRDNVLLVVMGKSESSYEKKIKGIYEDTLFTGYVPAPEHLQVTSLAHIGLAIYDSLNLNNQFCAPNKIYEYSAFGIPMVTSENPALIETIGAFGAGECVDYKNIDALTNALEKIIDNYETYSKNATAFYENVDCGAIIGKIVAELNG